jgi:hypothetical protein
MELAMIAVPALVIAQFMRLAPSDESEAVARYAGSKFKILFCTEISY